MIFPLIFREIGVFPNLDGIFPLIFQDTGNQHSGLTEPSLQKFILVLGGSMIKWH